MLESLQTVLLILLPVLVADAQGPSCENTRLVFQSVFINDNVDVPGAAGVSDIFPTLAQLGRLSGVDVAESSVFG